MEIINDAIHYPLDHLRELNLLNDDDFKDMPQWNPEDICYGDVIQFKTELYKKAYERFLDKDIHDGFSTNKELMQAYADFKERNKDWLDDYALFMAGKDYHNGAPWYMWKDNLKNPTAAQRAKWEKKLAKEIGYYEFLQFFFDYEWSKLKKYANDKGIRIIGDIPIFVALDSADVWVNKKLFSLDSKGYPTVVAGVPPDHTAGSCS